MTTYGYYTNVKNQGGDCPNFKLKSSSIDTLSQGITATYEKDDEF